jgi:arsenate reductase
MAILFYEYATCSTCQKARMWLEAHKVKFRSIPIAEQPPTEAQLKDYVAKSGLDPRKFFNTSGVVYREQKISDRIAVMSHGEMLKLLASNGKLIKRPLLVDGDKVLVGFKEADYAKWRKG